MEREPGHGSAEHTVIEGQGLGDALAELDCFQAFGGASLLGRRDHGRSGVETGDAGSGPGEGGTDDAGAAGEIQDGGREWLAEQADEGFDGGFGVEGAGIREGGGLGGEFLACAVEVGGHGGLRLALRLIGLAGPGSPCLGA